MPPLGQVDDAPVAFRRAIASLRALPVRPEVVVEDMPAPQRLAPHSAALSGAVLRDGDEIALGRLIVLYDPEGTRDWPGPFRVVAYMSAELEPEIAADPLIGQVAWSWLVEALASRGADYTAPSGTVTRAITEGFGEKSGQPTSTELELRASWSPADEDLSGHTAAWCDLMCTAAGLPPLDVAPLQPRRPS
ncbi:DUF3000 domain-containing protein [Allonocardiopsis opalescens]|uniref:DUF3000 family protein n=1 Tax=Allonocardiopsis opalescens TaxID=1144618 RepID=A0A2T0PUI0_9ACTN|nr:DUF3000 domain-containing protein [Allonocardiopsis opalescens]PRX92386.1 Protein of unknown function (DUF3000) [Allonocardiopsis opalescens]